MATRADADVPSLMNLAAEVVERARKGGADIAEAVARSGSELSTKVRVGEPELVEEAAHRSLGMRVIKNKRVALTSTSDLTPRGIERFVADALELADISQEDPFAGPADPELITAGPFPELELYDPAGGEINAAQAIDLATRGEKAARRAVEQSCRLVIDALQPAYRLGSQRYRCPGSIGACVYQPAMTAGGAALASIAARMGV